MTFKQFIPGRVAQSVTCLTADMCLTAELGVVSLILARSHTFLEVDHEIISLFYWFKKGCCLGYKWKYVHKVLVNPLVKLAQEKSVVKWTDRLDMNIAVDWDIKIQTKQT